MHNSEEFLQWRLAKSAEFESDVDFVETSIKWMNEAVRLDYSYMFEWLGVPVIQFPGDLFLIQEAIFNSKANKVIEVGIARGGTTLFLASILDLIGFENGISVIGVDILVSPHTQAAIDNSKFSKNIATVTGSSIAQSTFDSVSELIDARDRVLVILDSNHSMNHVFEEMKMYSKLVTKGSYLIVMDTAIEYVDSSSHKKDRSWGKGNNPDSAIRKFLFEYPGVLEIDDKLNRRSLPGASKGGFLKRI